MTKTCVLITVTTYPHPSSTYDDLVCIAGILEDGSWIRIYPVPFKYLKFKKWQWVELELEPCKPTHDFRPESRRPKHVDLSDLVCRKKLGTKQNWYERKQACLNLLYTNMATLIERSKGPENVSLAVFKPSQLINFIVEDDDPEWKPELQEKLKQLDLFTAGNNANNKPRIPIEKIPYKFKYEFKDEEGKSSKMVIQDWEINALYRNCLAGAEGDEFIAIEKVKKKYGKDFMRNKDIYLFLGTTLKHHRARHNNPFTIIGVFYPPSDPQMQLF